MKKIIAFVGWKNSGKTHIANHIAQKYGFTVLNFSDSLKEIITMMFGIDRQILDGTDSEKRKLKEEPLPYWSERLGFEVSPRNLMTGIGTALRSWCPDIWVVLLENRMNSISDERIIISDLRAENEYNMLKKYNAFVVWILHDQKKWMTTGIKAANGDEEAIRWMNQNNIHRTEYEWLKFVENCDFIYRNDKKGIDEASIEKMMEEAERKWMEETK